MLFCLLQPSSKLSQSEISRIDENLVLVAHRGREPGLVLRRDNSQQVEEKIILQDWASELCNKMKGVASLLDNANHCENYFSSVKSQIASVLDPELTPSARMLADMTEHDEGFFHYAQRMSKHHYQYYKNHALTKEKVKFFEDMTSESLRKKKQIEVEDTMSFDDYLDHYFKEA